MTFIWKNNSTLHKCLAVDSAKYIDVLINDCYLSVVDLFDLALILEFFDFLSKDNLTLR
jgi:hypothetical protein